MSTHLVLAVVIALLILPGSAWGASDGSLDVSFSGDGLQTTAVGTADIAQGVAIQTDGRIVTVGSAHVGTTDDFAIARYNADGSLDTTFSGDGKDTTSFGTGEDLAMAVAIQADGKIVVAGSSVIGSFHDFAVARYTTAGVLDTTFSGDGKQTVSMTAGENEAHAVAIQPDGRILLAGTGDTGGATYDTSVARLTTAGVLDTTFSGDGMVIVAVSGAYDVAESIVVQPGGQVVTAGSAYMTGYDMSMLRFSSAGVLDTTFSGDGIATFAITGTTDDFGNAMALQSDGKFVVAGEANGFPYDLAVIRVGTTGVLDTTFSGDGKVTTTFAAAGEGAEAVSLQADGAIVASGYADMGTYEEFAVARFTSVGVLDTTFSGDGLMTSSIGATNDHGHAAALQSDEKIVVVGDATPTFGLMRLGFPAPPVITDNQVGDTTPRAANVATYDVDFSDSVGLAKFETQIYTAAASGGTLVQAWTQVATLSGTSSTTDWSLLASSWTALPQGTSYVSVRVTNTGALATTLVDAFVVVKDTVAPSNPGSVADGSGADVAYTATGASLTANWPAGADTAPGTVASYDWCVVATTASTSCTGAIATGNVASPTTSVTTSAGGPYANGGRYFVCVRTRDGAGNGGSAAYVCSNGQYVDTSAPTAPTAVLDGVTAPDIDDDPTLPLNANWAIGSDAAPGATQAQDWCFNETADCTTTPVEVGSAAPAATGAVSTSSAYVAGTRYFFCVRTRDAAGNASAYACSNGQTWSLSLTVGVTAYDATGAGPMGGATPTTALGVLNALDVSVGEVRVAVTTNGATGYTLAAHDPDASGAVASSTSNIPWTSAGTVAAPAAWSGSGVGISAYGGASTPARWCTGGQVNCTSKTAPNLLWAPLDATVRQVSGAPVPVAGDVTRLPVRVRVPAAQAPGSYSGTIVITVVASG